MGEMTIDDNETSCSTKDESYVTENGIQDSDEDEEIGSFRRVSKKRTGRAILDDSDEEIEENPSEIPQITEITVDKLSNQSDSNEEPNDPSDPIPFSINKFLQESDLFDAEESDEETRPDSKQENVNVNTKQKKTKVKKTVKTKQSIRKEKEDVLNIHSETQRIIRQSTVSIPYHKPEQKPLQYFLNRKKTQSPTKIKPLVVRLDRNTTKIEPQSTENDIRIDSGDDSDDLPDPFAIGDEKPPKNEAENAKIEEISPKNEAENAKSEEISPTEPVKESLEPENALFVRATTPNEQKSVKSVGLTSTIAALRQLKVDTLTPRLSVDPLNLDIDYKGQGEFVQRFTDHTLKLSKGEKVGKREDGNKKVVKFSETPGAQLLSLKEELRIKMAERREIERLKRIELHEMDNEEGFGSEGENEAEEEEEEEAELTDQTDTDEEEEDEDEDIVSSRGKKARRNIFIDDEAEDDEEDADDEEEIEENDDLEESNRDVSISGCSESKTVVKNQFFEEEIEKNDDVSICGVSESKIDAQNQIFEETENNTLDTSNMSVDNDYGMVAMGTPGQRYMRSLTTEKTQEYSPDTLKNRQLDPISSEEDEAGLDSSRAIHRFDQSPTTQLGYHLNLSFVNSQIYEKSQRVVMDDLIGMCSGQFGSAKSPCKNMRKLIDPENRSQNFDDLVALCSGKFGSPVRNFVDERKRKRDEIENIEVLDNGNVDFQCKNDEIVDFRGRNDEFIDFRSKNEEFIDFRGKNSEISDERKRRRVETEEEIEQIHFSDNGNVDFQRKNDGFVDFRGKNSENNDEIKEKRVELEDIHVSDDGNVDSRRENDEIESDEDETGELFPQNATRKRKIVFESSESEAELSESGDDEEAIYDENEEIVTKNVNRKQKIAEFFEKEAELSGSDASSDEDDMSEDDVLQEELGDMDECLPNQDALRDQVGRAHFKAMDDKDAREVRLLKEKYLPDGDLHTDGKGRERKFKWRDIYDEFQDGMETNNSDEENGDDNEQEQEELRKKMEKLDKDKWMHEKAKEGELDEPEVEFLNVRTKTHLTEVSVAEKSPIPFNFLSPMSPTKMKYRRGSFFSKAQSNPNKTNDKTKTIETNAMGVKNSKKFVFIAVSPPKKPVVETPEVSSVRKRPKLDRKNLNSRFNHQTQSIFKFL